jgi:hypothetical protein
LGGVVDGIGLSDTVEEVTPDAALVDEVDETCPLPPELNHTIKKTVMKPSDKSRGNSW